MKKPWVLDAVIGLVLSLIVAGSYLTQAPFLESVELKAFDMRSKLRQHLDPSPEIVLIAIDDASISQLGRWPWPRTRIAGMIDKLSAARPRVIGLNILFSEPEQNQGLIEIKKLQDKFQSLVAAKKLVDKGSSFNAEFSSATDRLDADSKLLASIAAAQNVVLPMTFTGGGKAGAKPDDLPPAVSSSALTVQLVPGSPQFTTPDGSLALTPLAQFAQASLGVGHVNLDADFDGVVRHEVPALKYLDNFYPSYGVQLVLGYLGMRASDATLFPGQKLQLGKLTIPLDANNGMLTTFNGPDQTFRYYSFFDVINDKVSMDVFKDKIVILGPTALGVGTLNTTPVAHNFPSLEIVANVAENILHQKFLRRPVWAANMELGLLGVTALFIMAVLPRLKALWGSVASLFLLVAMLGAGVVFFTGGDWVKVTYPAVLLTVGYLVITSKRFLVTEKGKELVEASAIETNKMLGLSFQGQGMLDMAFEKFRLCPLDDNMKDTLYNLALDFERKRQYSKAVSALSHISAKDPKFKDIAEKMKVLKQASEGAVFGGLGGAKKEGTVMISGGATKPTLGRYEIEKELGRGAMGIVYLGKDPKINRQVAIKTMTLDEGSDAASTKEIKERFFREAESAGTLNHPNIVRIFDAGEEQDISYIAMELLNGADLVQFTAKDKLLAPAQAMEYVAIVADALDYAHAQGIVHRDIKPANIMLLKDGTIRVADFGIARITASSKTATGTVMGTPSYMSPEQVAGKKVDGRSDLFSLTVALFEFLTGEKPFKGGEGIGTLLFQIANDPHPDPLTIKPDLPPCVAAIINKGLAKNPDQRYPRGSAMATDLRACIAALKSGAPMPAAKPEPKPAAETTQPVPAAPEPVAAAAPSGEPIPTAAATLELAPAAVPAPEPIPATVPVEPTAFTISADAFAQAMGAPEEKPAEPQPEPKPEPAPGIEMVPSLAKSTPAAPSPDATLKLGTPIDLSAFAPPAPAPAPAPEESPKPAASPDATIRLEPPKEPKP